MSEPLISIVIPAYNAENTLARAVHSICLNGTVSVQILVVENGSTDQTTDEANKFSSDDFRVLHSEIGVSRARN